MDPSARHQKYSGLSEEQLTLMLWGRCARFARIIRDYPELTTIADEERRMIRRLGELRPAEEVLTELRQNPEFLKFEEETQARRSNDDANINAELVEAGLIWPSV